MEFYAGNLVAKKLACFIKDKMMTVKLTGLQITVEVVWYFTGNCYKFTCLLRSHLLRRVNVFCTVLALLEENLLWIGSIYGRGHSKGREKN